MTSTGGVTQGTQNLPEGERWEGIGGAGEEGETDPVHVASVYTFLKKKGTESLQIHLLHEGHP